MTETAAATLWLLGALAAVGLVGVLIVGLIDRRRDRRLDWERVYRERRGGR